MPMIASAFLTNPSLNGESGWKFAIRNKNAEMQSALWTLKMFSLIWLLF